MANLMREQNFARLFAAHGGRHYGISPRLRRRPGLEEPPLRASRYTLGQRRFQLGHSTLAHDP